MGWISRDHRCACGHITIALHDRADEAEQVPCEVCGAPAGRIISANITQVSLVDGNGRFDSIRERRKVEREFKKAQRLGKKDDAKRLKRELSKAGVTK